MPATNSLTFVGDRQKTIPLDSYTVTLPDEEGTPMFMLKKPTGADFTSAIWKCKILYEQKDTNCCVVDKIDVYKPPMQQKAPFRNVVFQVVTNFKDIAIGDEIVVYKEKIEKPAPPSKKVLVDVKDPAAEPLAKKGRIV